MSESLFQLHRENLADVPRNLPLIILTRPVADVGQIVEGLQTFMFNEAIEETLVSFKADLLLDYRAHRPEMGFERDHFTSYQPEELTLSLGSDSLGNQFLLLAGFEPDYRWERFADSVLLLIAELQVSVTFWGQAFPMPVPHTRPIAKTISGTREDVIAELTDWQPSSRIAASITQMLEYRLTLLGEDVVGCTLFLPNYLATNYYPTGMLAAISVISRVTGLVFSTERVIEEEARFAHQLANQLQENEEFIELVAALEARYDKFKARESRTADLLGSLDDMPSAEELGHEFEQFLAQGGTLKNHYRADRASGLDGINPGAKDDRTDGDDREERD
ncbi:PAC2 family protein [Canibacter zhoujuaniae]|uniref:PAC2 family protein n=1 Tax=Canibacter zhoujuaniae TaxID=2708343 RepID=UPI00141F8F8F|nr:PAC2 family protein [Canibacter zhoujuaniae]